MAVIGRERQGGAEAAVPSARLAQFLSGISPLLSVRSDVPIGIALIDASR